MPSSTASTLEWEERVSAFWRDADADQPQQTLRSMVQLLLDAPADSTAGLFEWASLHDFLGREHEAIPQYRAALDGHLDPERREQAIVQLASSLRNIGRPDEAVMLLESSASSDSVGAAPQAFLALALHDAGSSDLALRVALTALAETLPIYGDAVTRYATALTPPN